MYLECGKLIFLIIVFSFFRCFVVLIIVFLIFCVIFFFKYFFGKVIFIFWIFWLILVVKLFIVCLEEVEFFILCLEIIVKSCVFFFIVWDIGLIWLSELLKVNKLKCDICL